MNYINPEINNQKSTIPGGTPYFKRSFDEREKIFFSSCCPKKYVNARLDTAEYIPKSILNYCRDWAKNPTSIFITGSVGVGKTYLAFSMLREIFKVHGSRYWPKYLTSPALDSKLLQAILSPQGDSFDLQSWIEEDVLFIDDFGRERHNDRIQQQYFTLMDGRYVEERPTIITSNLSLSQVYEVMGDAIASRISEWPCLEIEGRDNRKDMFHKNEWKRLQDDYQKFNQESINQEGKIS